MAHSHLGHVYGATVNGQDESKKKFRKEDNFQGPKHVLILLDGQG